jgi:hypothetical protein
VGKKKPLNRVSKFKPAAAVSAVRPSVKRKGPNTKRVDR